MLNAEAIEALEPILKKRLPRNLEELKMIDVKSNPALNDELINKLFGCQVRKLTLVNCELSEKTFETLVSFVNTSSYLYELDLSWCPVRHSTFIKILPVIKTNT